MDLSIADIEGTHEIDQYDFFSLKQKTRIGISHYIKISRNASLVIINHTANVISISLEPVANIKATATLKILGKNHNDLQEDEDLNLLKLVIFQTIDKLNRLMILDLQEPLSLEYPPEDQILMIYRGRDADQRILN